MGSHGTTSTSCIGPAWYVALCEAWFRHLARRGRARKTIRAYGWAARDFGTWLQHCRVDQPEHLIVEVVHSWQDSLSDRELAGASRAMVSSAVRSLLRWGAREGLGIRAGLWEHVDPVQVPEALPRALEPAHIATILGYYARPRRDVHELRDRALFFFLLTTGSRISAALSLDVEQLTAGRLVVRQKGGSEHRLVPSTKAVQWTQEYLRARGRDDQPALWIRIGPRGRHRLLPAQANEIWAELCRELRIPTFTSHQLKHTAATEMGERGASDSEIAHHVGWKGTAMAQRYRQLRADRRKQLVDQLDDLVPAVAVAAAAPARRRRPRVEVLVGKRRKR